MRKNQCQVFFVGAGPGDPELLTIKGKRCIEQADLVLYAGSLVPVEVVSCAKDGAKVVDSSPMTLEKTHKAILETVKKGGTVARVHTGDPSLFGAIREQMLLLDRDGITYEVIPGVSAAFAAAAAARISYTVPEVSQSLIITRTAGRTKLPPEQALKSLAKHQSAMAIYLSAAHSEQVQAELLAGGYEGSTPVVVAYRVGWPDEIILKTSLEGLSDAVAKAGIKRQAVFLILPGQGREPVRSKLYSGDFTHSYRTQLSEFRKLRNSKSEYRNPKQILIFKCSNDQNTVD